VRITDDAIIAAATLSHRYIGDRFLPDKAIDLIDEAASRLRIEIDSMPTEIDVVERRMRQLEIERVALAKETDDASRERLARLDEELANLREQSDAMKAHWEQEKDAIAEIRSLKEELEAKRTAVEREADLEKAAEIRYGQIPDLERKVEEATAKLAELQATQKMLKEEVEPEDVAEVVSRWTGVPVTRLLEGEVAKLVRLEDVLHERVVGQDEAVSAVANAIRRSRAGLSDPNRPIGSFLFLGPTGVGKTELCKALAEIMFDSEEAVVRIDMSEFGEKHNVSWLIGAPPGYVGYEEGGALTEAIRRRPYAVVLLDEIEKAHRDVFNVLLQVLDDGRLTDGQGRTVDFTNTIVVMTSNIGSQMIQQITSEGGTPEEIDTAVRDILKEKFLPEFLNRIDETIVFHPLDREQIAKIVDLQLARFAKLLAERDVRLEVTDAARRAIASEGYDPAFGARPLKRVIQQRLQNPLATELLKGRIPEHGGVRVDFHGEQFTFEPLPPEAGGPARHEGRGTTKVETVEVS
jgi:ATP-dependent Clp protease ATP-binding subunit ClpB